MAYFNYKSNNIYYEEMGTGVPLLMLHGNTASSAMFSGIAEKYSESFKVILMDFLGHGNSDRLEEFPTDFWFDEAQQVIAFLKAKDYRNVNVIGCSGGALVAINVALEEPQLLSKVVDNDTLAIIRHEREIGRFFHKDISNLKPDILMTGSNQDEFVAITKDFFTN